MSETQTRPDPSIPPSTNSPKDDHKHQGSQNNELRTKDSSERDTHEAESLFSQKIRKAPGDDLNSEEDVDFRDSHNEEAAHEQGSNSNHKEETIPSSGQTEAASGSNNSGSIYKQEATSYAYTLRQEDEPKKSFLSMAPKLASRFNFDDEDENVYVAPVEPKPVFNEVIHGRIMDKLSGNYHVSIWFKQRCGYFKCQLAEKEAMRVILNRQKEAKQKNLKEYALPVGPDEIDLEDPEKNHAVPEEQISPDTPSKTHTKTITFPSAWEHIKKLDLGGVKQANDSKKMDFLYSCLLKKLPPRLSFEKKQMIALSQYNPVLTDPTFNSILFTFYHKLTLKPIDSICGNQWKHVGFLSENPIKELTEHGVRMFGALQMLAFAHLHFHCLLKMYLFSLTKRRYFSLVQVLAHSSKNALLALKSNKLDKQILKRKSVVSTINQFYFANVLNFFICFKRDSARGNPDAGVILRSNDYYTQHEPMVLLDSFRESLDYLNKITDSEFGDI